MLRKEALDDRLVNEVTPLVDDDRVTFVWKGKTAPALVGDITGWEEGKSIPLEKCSRGLWSYQVSFPTDAYIEYGFVSDGQSLGDPLNPRQTPNGMGGFNNYFSMPHYKPSKLTRFKRKIAHGTLAPFSLPAGYFLIGEKRTVHLYQPPVKEPVPLVVVWDGQDYLKRVRLNYIVDNLIAKGRIRPVAMAFINNAGEKSRAIEYAPSEATLTWLVVEVLPLAQRELNLVNIDKNPGAYGVLGASMGGLMAVYTGERLPHIFGHVLSQSGAFSMAGMDMVVFDLLEREQKLPLKFWLDVGAYDLAGLLDTNRKLYETLMRRGYAVAYREYHAGHNFPSWRDEIGKGFESLFGLTWQS